MNVHYYRKLSQKKFAQIEGNLEGYGEVFVECDEQKINSAAG